MPTAARADWTAAGGTLNLNTTDSLRGDSIAAISGVPYVAWTEQNAGGVSSVYVKHWNGTKWVQNGGALNIDSSADAGQPGISGVDGAPYVTWTEGLPPANFTVYVARWTGTAWQQVGPGAVNPDHTQPAESAEIAGVGTTPYVTWEESNGDADQVYVAHFSGGSWHLDGSALNVDPTHDADDPAIADIDGVPYVTWTEDPIMLRGNQIYVAHLGAGDTWVHDGGSLNVNAADNASAGPSIANVGGLPTVAWEETNQGTNQVYVKQFMGAAWVQDGGPLNLDDVDSADGPVLADIDGLPYVAFDQSTPAQLDNVTVERWDGTAWGLVGGTVIQGTNPIRPRSPRSAACRSWPRYRRHRRRRRP
jgi:hypothetical protein